MSSNKKLSGILIVALLALAVGAWLFLGQKGSKMPELTPIEQTEQEDLTGQSSQPVTVTPTHDHDHAAAKKGKIHQLSVNPLLGVRGVGDPNAPVKIHEFFSLTCSHCANFHTGPYQELKEKYIDTGKVYFIHQEFPLNGPALYGSMIARCLPQERYHGFIDLLLRNQEKWTTSGDFKVSLKQNAKLAGMSDEEFDTCFDNKDLQAAIANNIKEASEAWEIRSTPTFVLNNGERILQGGQEIEVFDAVITELTNGGDGAVDEHQE